MVEILWAEWGAALSDAEHAEWLYQAEQDCRLNTVYSAAFLARDGHRAVGIGQLRAFDIDSMRDRSPWIWSMVVRPEYRGRQIGRRLLEAIEAFAHVNGMQRLWVFTKHAATFYESCRWERYGEAEQGGERGVVLTKSIGAPAHST